MTSEPSQETLSIPNYNWFYDCLLRIGPSTLTGAENWMVDWFRDEGTCSELLWRVGMEEAFHDNWVDSQELAILEAYDEYIQAAQEALLELPVSSTSEGWLACSQTRQTLCWVDSVRQITGSLNEQQVCHLVAAARAPTKTSRGFWLVSGT